MSAVKDIVVTTREVKIRWAGLVARLADTDGARKSPSGIREKENERSADVKETALLCGRESGSLLETSGSG